MLTHADHARLLLLVQKRQRWLNALCRRLDALNVPPTDPVYIAATRARAAMQDLATACHYGSVESGVCRPDQK